MADVSSTTSSTSSAIVSTTSSAPTSSTEPTSSPTSTPPTSSPGSSSEPTSSPTSSAPASSQQGSSTGQSSSAAGSSAGQTSSVASASGATSTAAPSSSRSQVVETSYVLTTVTDGSGNLVTQSAPVTVTSSVDVPANGGSSGGSSNTGAIVGGVVGGVVGLILILGALWFFLRKRRRSHRDDFDDGMFDPSRAQNHAPVDLADSGPNTVEPFYTPGVASTAQSPQMTQYPGSASATSEGYGAQGLSRGPSTATSAGYAGQGAGFGTMQMPEPHFGGAGGYGAAAAAGAAGVGAGAMAGMSAKQREAYQDRQNNRVGGPAAAPQQYGGVSGSGPAPMSPSSTSDGPVTVAEDGGAYNETNEIPPTYDSIQK